MAQVYGEPGFAFMKDIDRPSAQLVEALRKFPAAIIGDGLGRRAIMDAQLKPLNPDLVLCGTAVTVEVRVGDNLMIHTALKLAQKGDVLVVNAHGDLHHGLWGEITTRMALKKGLAGIVIDGAVRDAQFIRHSGLPLFCRGVMPCGGGKEGPGQVNFPVSCGGVVVQPGDVVVGDSDGIVVVPKDKLSLAIERAQQRLDIETKRIAGIEQGQIYPKFLMPTLRAKGLLNEEEEI